MRRKERRLVGFKELHQRYGRGRTENAFRVFVWRRMREGDHPRAVQVGPNSIGWWGDELDAWEATLPRVGVEPEGAA